MHLQEFRRDYFDFLHSDMLEQFKGDDKMATSALLRAFARQHDSLLEAFCSLVTKTNIEDAEGAQLDGCGDIVKLTRAQAGMLSNEVTTDFSSIAQEVIQQVTTPTELLRAHEHNGIIPFNVIDDERYRTYVKFKVFLNTNHCTQPDVMKALGMFWTRSPVGYVEDVHLGGVDYHASILLRTPELPNDGSARLFYLIPVIKAAGISLLREATTVTAMEANTIRYGGAVFDSYCETVLPPLDTTRLQESAFAPLYRTEHYTETILPELED